MKDKPNESQLIAYLYGDLSALERKEMEDYIKTNPELVKEMEELGMVREMLGKFPDREVPEPTIIIPERKSITQGFSRTWISIAATLLILIIAGFGTGLNIKFDSEGFLLSFGNSDGSEKLYSGSEVEEMMASAMLKVSGQLDAKFNDFQNGIDASLASYQENNDDKIDDAYRRLLSVSKNQIASYVKQMDRQQKKDIESLFALSQDQQQVYFNSILTDFTAYLDKQRQVDMENIDSYLTKFTENVEFKQMETEQVISNIISQVNGQTISD